MKKLIILFFNFLVSLTAFCQSDNDIVNDQIDYYAYIYRLNWYNGVDGGEAGNIETAWKVKSRTSSAYSNDCNTANYNDDYCFTDVGEDYYYPNTNDGTFRTGSGRSNSENIYYAVVGWENDYEEDCQADGNDDLKHCGRGTLDITNYEIGAYTYGAYNIGAEDISSIKMHQYWRYTHGQWGESPLDFGTISVNQEKSNYNSSTSHSHKSTQYGYQSTFSFPGITDQRSNDVTYQFTISEQPLSVNIDITDNIEEGTSSTVFDGNLYLLKESGNSYELIDTDLDKASPTISSVLDVGTYVVVFEGQDQIRPQVGYRGIEGDFKISIAGIEPVLTEGSIVNNSPYVKDGCSITQGISNVNSATTTYDTFTYSWYKKIMDNVPEWELILGASNENLTADELGQLSGENVYIKRRASQLGVEVETDSVLITLKSIGESGHDGTISGKITGKDRIGSIGDVRIILTSNAKGECMNFSDTTYSNPNNGAYSFGNLYYEDNSVGAHFTLWAEFLDHGFKPDTIFNIFIENGVPNDNNTNLIFEDTTSIFINGRVYQVDENLDTCGLPDVSFYLNDVLQTTTESNELGEYNLVITQRDNDNLYDVRPDSSLYKFDPIDINDVFVVQDVFNNNFENPRRDTIRGSVTACGGFYFGSVELLIEDLNGGCFRYTVETDNTGNYEIVVPARSYTVSVVGVTTDPNSLPDGYTIGAIENYFMDIADTVDVTTNAAVSNFIYRQAPILSIDYLPTNSCGDMTDTVFYQGVPVNIVFNVVEQNTGNCPLDSGRLVIQDNISGRSENIELAIQDGRALYEIFPDQPLLVDDHKKSFTATAMDVENADNIDVVSFRAIIDGNVPQASVEQTVSPDIPMLILRDPPGDNSFSFFKQDSSTSFSSSFEALVGGEVKRWKKMKAGVKFSTGVGFITDFEASVSVNGSYTMSTQRQSQIETSSTLTLSQEFKTSSDDDAIGADADLFVGGAFNITYGLTDIIEYDTATCTINKDIALIMSPDSLATTFAYTAKTIKGVLIPRFEQLIELSTDEKEKRRYENQISVWTQMIERNEELKEDAIATDSTFSFGGDVSWTRSTTESSTSKSFYEFDLDITREIATSAKLETAASYLEGGVDAKFRYYLGRGSGVVTEKTTTVGYTLEDDDDSDLYVVDIKYDETYGTPVFDATSQTSSCPYTGGTKVDNPVLTVTPSTQANIDPDGQATYSFKIINNTQMPQGGDTDFSERSYVLDIDNSSNPHGAGIVVGGDGIFPLEFDDIAKGQQVTRDIAITRQGAANQNIYAYEGLKFDLQPVCQDLPEEDFPNASVQINAYFTSECSGINLMEPANGWIHNSESNVMSILINDYDKTKMTNLTLQYSKAGLNSWIDEINLNPNSLNNNSTIGHYIDWVVPDTVQGEYDLRMKLTCDNGVLYSLRSSGLIDTKGPTIFGLPTPIDDVYDPSEDIISISYNEDIDCDNVVSSLTHAITGVEVPHTVSCSGNTLQIVPNSTLDTSVYRVIVSNVEDTYSNASTEYRWLFLTDGYVFDPNCSPISVSNNNLNQDAISQSTYRSIQISSDGTVGNGTTVEYEAEESISLMPGFEVVSGGQLLAEIETCENE